MFGEYERGAGSVRKGEARGQKRKLLMLKAVLASKLAGNRCQ